MCQTSSVPRLCTKRIDFFFNAVSRVLLNRTRKSSADNNHVVFQLNYYTLNITGDVHIQFIMNQSCYELVYYAHANKKINKSVYARELKAKESGGEREE